jgi:hypothetical protein
MIGIKPKLGDLTLNSEQEIILLKRRVQELEGLILQGTPIRPSASSTSAPGAPGAPGAAMTPAQVLNIVIRAQVIEERITTTGTAHALANLPALDSSGNPVVFLVLNGVDLRRGGTGNQGWSFTGPNAITTIRSMVASDALVARYVRRTL